MERTPNIGIFDSGVGGLTVLKALQDQWPQFNYYYLADTARLPYGNKSPETILKYCSENFQFLLSKNVEAVVVACNSASAALLAQPIPLPVPVFNVVEPGARQAVQSSGTQCIGILGTRATINSQAYVKAVRQLSPSAKVLQQPCPLLVPIVEEGMIDDPLTNMLVYRYLQPLLTQPIDTLVLGCTHYPILRKTFEKVILGHQPAIQLVDSTLGLVEDLQNKLQLSPPTKSTNTKAKSFHFFSTDPSPRLEELITIILGESAEFTMAKA